MRLTQSVQVTCLCVVVVLIAGAPGFSWPQPVQPASQETPVDVDIDDLIAECQQSVRGKEYAGIVWWIPVEFWETGEQQPGQFAPLREYTMIAVFVGKVGPLGGISFVPGSELRSQVVLRDSQGIDYSPLQSVLPDAENLAAGLKPILANAIGRVGENMEVLFFAAKDEQGNALADPTKKGRFSIVLKDVAGPGESIYAWQLPLTSLLPPKFCPVGKEKVKANWNDCPWHGNSLVESQSPAP